MVVYGLGAYFNIKPTWVLFKSMFLVSFTGFWLLDLVVGIQLTPLGYVKSGSFFLHQFNCFSIANLGLLELVYPRFFLLSFTVYVFKFWCYTSII